MRTKHLLLLLTLSSMVACTGNKTDNTESDEDSVIVETEKSILETDSIHLTEQKKVSNEEGAPSYSIDVNLQYAKGNTVVCDSINASIISTFLTDERNSDVAGVARNFFDSKVKEYREDLADYADPDNEFLRDMKYAYEIKGEFVPETVEGVLTYCSTGYMYTGGAHGAAWAYYINFDKNTGKVLNLAKTLDLSHSDEIISLIVEQLVKDNNCQTVEQLQEETAILTMGDMYISENFLIAEDGIIFHYGQYEIAPYAAGMQDVKISYQKLKKYLKKWN